jgi:hypothetical protein
LRDKWPKIRKEKGRTSAAADSPLQSDFAKDPMILYAVGAKWAPEVGADLRICPIDVVCELSKMRLGVLKMRLGRAGI